MTIEEMAREQYGVLEEPMIELEDCTDTDQVYDRGCYDGYIAGATEQKKIDIEKACEWFIKNWVTYINPTTNTVIPAYNFAQAFRKAMEE